MSKGLDAIGWYIATLHQVLGHAKAAAVLGQPPYNPDTCVLCLHDRNQATRADVINALGVER